MARQAPACRAHCPCLTVAGLQEALEAVAAVEALLPAGSGLLLELGTLQARWLNDVLALGEFLRAAREAHEVLRRSCASCFSRRSSSRIVFRFKLSRASA